MPSRGSGEETAEVRTTESPWRTTTAPCACLARRPVSNVRDLPPDSSTVTSCFINLPSGSVATVHSAYAGNTKGQHQRVSSPCRWRGGYTNAACRKTYSNSDRELFDYLRMPSLPITWV